MKDMNEKNIKLEEEFKKLKVEMWKEAKKILETEYPRSCLLYTSIISKTNGKWIFCKHKERDTYEVPGGHRAVSYTHLDVYKRQALRHSHEWLCLEIFIPLLYFVV